MKPQEKSTNNWVLVLGKREYLGLLVFLFIIGICIGYNIHPVKVEFAADDIERLPKNESLVAFQRCEIWQICDYIQTSCISTGWHTCPEKYTCWFERRNCDSDFEIGEPGVWSDWIHVPTYDWTPAKLTCYDAVDYFWDYLNPRDVDYFIENCMSCYEKAQQENKYFSPYNIRLLWEGCEEDEEIQELFIG